ncbi:P-loop containing nucleoside triphosphatehydrolases superfamily protein [Striga asiatica]|uniref:P-loop containing nucleoside triphosphatehydrolases superfamily protein n=1 Tax=Striga asiatica TaxID=4170 RepID=A0A5A7PMS2_STRAF|nr:P-loop containing nucleoside triphosphatehydrolases superfamily protein [Striga asiatica]
MVNENSRLRVTLSSCKSSDSDSDDAKEDAYLSCSWFTFKFFAAAVAYSRMMEYNFISPEHIIMFTVDDGSINRVLKSGTLSYIAILLVLGFTHMQSIYLDFEGEENTGVIKGVALHVSSEQNGQMATPPRVVPSIGCGGAAIPYSGRSLHHEGFADRLRMVETEQDTNNPNVLTFESPSIDQEMR